jgi:hypothetical protein
MGNIVAVPGFSGITEGNETGTLLGNEGTAQIAAVFMLYALTSCVTPVNQGQSAYFIGFCRPTAPARKMFVILAHS